MLLRNGHLRRAVTACVAITIMATVAAWLLSAHAAIIGDARLVVLVACACTLLSGACCSLVMFLESRRRYRDLATLAERVDSALSGDRDVSLADMREGEVAILANEVDKAINRLRLSSEELARDKAALADSLADISHQVRTPLTSLGLLLALMRKDAKTPEERERIRTGEQLLSQMRWLVEALLRLARIDAGTITLRKDVVRVDDMVRTAIEPLEITADIADVRITTDVAPDATFVGDESWTAEALRNVVKNCIEHTPTGGEVTVSAREDVVACRICVTDTGPGISDEDLPHVFERFYRGGNASKSDVNPTGVGIGLSLSRSLVNAQDGRLCASNATDADGNVCGARFDMTFFKVIV